ncbi:MAG: porin family protein [Gammaproteobacteria bacterium]|nr:porin family protein [Gammaproteobacteria bacterium]
MKKLLIVFLLLGYFSPGAYAEEPGERKYAGVFYGIVDSGDGDVEAGNLGLVIGGYVKSGLGVELIFSDTINEDDKENNLGKVRYKSQVWGLLGSYRFGDKVYGLVKAGYTFLDVSGRITGLSSEKWEEEGLSYGIGAGVKVGRSGTIELNYLVLPDVTDRILNTDVEFENELISLGYNWNF